MRKSALLLVFAVLLVLISVSSVSAWYGDYDYRISYNTSKFTENQPFVLNGSNGILINSNKQIGFVLYNISLTDYYTYFDDETNIIAVANDGVNDIQIPIEWEIGNSSSYNNQSVYDANFKMVQHHKDNSSIGLKDSTSNNMNGVGRNIYSQNGLIGGAIYYNGLYDAATNSNVSYGNNPIGPAENLTIEVWFNYTDNGRFGNLLSTFKGIAGTIDDYILIIDSSSTLTNVYFERQTNTTESVSGWVEGFFKFGSYYHYVMVSNNTHLMLYVNSTLKYTVAFTNSAHTATTQAIFNGQFLANNGNAYQGQIDELRLSNVARSQSYITQTYNNVLGTSGYGTAGALEEPPPPSGEAVVTAHITSPTIVYPNIDFKFNMTATDSDNATINGYVQFYVNGTVSGTAQSQAMTNNTNTLIGTLSHSSFGLGSTLIAEYWASDGINTTAKANHSTVTVTSGAPNIPVLVSPANNLISEVNAVNLSVTVTDNQGDVMNVSFYNTTNWNVTSAVYFQSFLVSTHDTGMYGLYFKPDGTKMYFVGNTNDKVYEYDLSTIWDVSSATYLQEFDISAQDGHPYGLYFKPDGTKMYFVGQDNDRVYEYNLPIAWNVTSAVYLQSSSVLVDGNSAGLFFKPDGTKIYFVGYFNNKVYEYNLPIAWNVTSAVYLQNVSISIQNINSAGLFFKPDGTKIYSIDNGNQKIFEYNLPIAWNVTSAVYLQSSPILSDNSPIGLYFKSNGVKAYFIGLTGGRVYEYNLGTSTLLNTTTNIANGSTATYEWTNLADGVYNWYAVVTDGYESNTSSVWTFSIDTTAPQYSNVGINDTNVQINDSVLFYALWSDAVGDLNYSIFSWNQTGSWVNDSAVALTAWSNVTKILNSAKVEYAWKIYANDSLGHWNNTGTQTFTMNNTAPTEPTDISGFPANLYVTNTLTLTATGGTDADNDTITYHYKFYNVNESNTRQDWSATNSYTIVVADAHDTIRVYAKSTTIAANSSGNYNETDFVDDTVPTDPTDLTLTAGDIKVTETLTGTCTNSVDADGDTITYYYQFYNTNNTAERQAYSSDNTYVIAVVDAHDNMRIRCKAVTNYGESASYDEENKQIIDTLPTTPAGSSLTAGDVKVTNTLTGTGAGSTDADSDVITYHYQFYNTNDTTERQAKSSDNTYVIVVGDAHDNIRVRIWATTTYGDSAAYEDENKQIANTAPTQPTLTSPANNEINNTLTMNWTASTDADSDTIYYYVLMNGTQACYTTGLNCSYEPPDAYYLWNVTAFDGSVNGTTSTSRYFTYDTVSPTITLNPSNAFTATNTSTINNYNSTTFPINITFADERDLFAAEINITNATGYTMFNWTNISSISGLSYTYNNTLNNTAWTAGLYIINIIVSDSHTSMLTGDYELTKQKDELIFETPEANKITIEAVNAISSGTIKKGDRYQFEFSYPDTIKDTLVYNIESDNEIYYRPDSGYKAHFVIWNPRTKTGNWVDFEDSTLKDYTVQKVDDKHYTITFSIPAGIETVTFNSIGGLNVVTESYSWYRGLTSQSYTSPVLTNISTSFYLNATNTSIISDINARFFYNYTEYTVTKTTSADYGFKATVTTPSVALGSQNFNFTWNVSVNQTDGTQYNFSELRTQTVSTAQINVTIRDEIELYLINNETFNIYVINKGRYYTTTTGYVLIGNLSAGVPYIEIENANYPRRGYYITISENLTTYLTAYILRSSPSTQEVVFTIQNSGLTKIEDAKMTFYRIVNMTYVEVGQIQTDYAGQTALTLDTTNEYRIVIEATGYPIKTLELRPIQTSYIITLQETGAGFVNYFEGIAYTITPVNRTFNVSQNYTNFRLDIYSSNSDLEVFGLRTFDHTYTCVPASCATNVTGSPSGGSAVVQVIGNVTGTVKVDVFFKRTGYDLVYLNYNIYSFVNMITANIRSMWRLMNDFKTRYSPIMLALIAIIGTIVLLGTAAEIGVYGLPLIVIAAFGLIFFAVIGFLNPLVVGLSLILGGVVYFRFSGGGD